MISFGQRKIIKQGGSFMISLPMLWIKSTNPETKTVTVEMDSEKRLRVIAGDTRQDTTGSNNIHGSEYQ